MLFTYLAPSFQPYNKGKHTRFRVKMMSVTLTVLRPVNSTIAHASLRIYEEKRAVSYDARRWVWGRGVMHTSSRRCFSAERMSS
jgi:hypothetical protein